MTAVPLGRKHPNILCLVADELRIDCVGFGGNSVVRHRT